MKKIGMLLLFLPLLAIDSCKEDETIFLPPVYFNYVPTNINHSIIYDVDSTFYADFDSSVHYYHFQVMEKVESTYTDSAGRPTQRIERYKRDNISSPWQIASVWNSTLTATRFERYEDNERYIRLGFPINELQTWNGNALNNIGPEEYSYDSFHVPLSIGSYNFDSSLTVIQFGDTSLIHEKFGIEKYANHVGRVYKLYIDADKYVSGVYKKGTVMTETIYSYTP